MTESTDEHDEPSAKPAGKHRRPTLRSAARRLVGDPKAREILNAVLDSSDKVKTEAVRQVGREVRTYLEGLGLDDAILYLLTNYKLEVNASFNLKPIGDALRGDEEELDHYERLRRERESHRASARGRQQAGPSDQDTEDNA